MSARVVVLPSASPLRQQPAVTFGKTAWRRGFFRTLLDHLAGIDTRYRQRLDLQQLDDHLLKDIGVTRAELGRAFNGL